jgi:peroxiredoxin family protein
MSLSQQDRDEIKGLISLMNIGANARTESKLDLMIFSMEKVEIHLSKMNGRIASSETEIRNALIEREKNREHQRAESERLDQKIEESKNIHILACPQTAKIEAINEDLREYKMFKKYPKIAVGVLVFFVISFGIATYETYTKVAVNTKLNNEMLVKIDSLNRK